MNKIPYIIEHCNVEGCDNDARTRGMCPKHYQRMRQHGTTDRPAETDNCKHCGTEFTKRNAKHAFCSKRCNDQGKPSAQGLTCYVCGKRMARGTTSRPQGEARHNRCTPLPSRATGHPKTCKCEHCKTIIAAYSKAYREWYRSKHGKGYDDGRERNRTTYDKTCAFCGDEFTTHQARAKYCSSTCGVRHRSHTPGYFGEGQCPTCGATFDKTGVSHKYCSTECRTAPEAVERTVECAQCGSTFTTSTVRKTCSDECATERQDKLSQGRWSDLRRGYETNDADLFFTALIADCETGNQTECWEWNRRSSGSGYPLARFGKRNILLHRASLEMSEGKSLGVLHAHHKCANTICVNPNHLEPATAADNNLEMLARNSYIARIAELERALSEVAPGHEALNRVPTN